MMLLYFFSAEGTSAADQCFDGSGHRKLVIVFLFPPPLLLLLLLLLQ